MCGVSGVAVPLAAIDRAYSTSLDSRSASQPVAAIDRSTSRTGGVEGRAEAIAGGRRHFDRDSGEMARWPGPG
jgi:hypothetical protein